MDKHLHLEDQIDSVETTGERLLSCAGGDQEEYSIRQIDDDDDGREEEGESYITVVALYVVWQWVLNVMVTICWLLTHYLLSSTPPISIGWMDNHPGGKEILLLAAGRDITYAFDSYHPFTDKAEKSKSHRWLHSTGDKEFLSLRTLFHPPYINAPSTLHSLEQVRDWTCELL